jgi:hypothetical protein
MRVTFTVRNPLMLKRMLRFMCRWCDEILRAEDAAIVAATVDSSDLSY